MVRFISQETFNEVVQENMNEFNMTEEEAVEEAVKQFEAQGVDLANIVKAVGSDIIPSDDSKDIENSIKNLEYFGTVDVSEEAMGKEFVFLAAMCEKSVPHKVFIAKNESCQKIALDLLVIPTSNVNLMRKGLKFLTAMLSEQPDVMNSFLVFAVTSYMNREDIDVDCLIECLKLIKICCVRHEKNRQEFFASETVNQLICTLRDFKNNRFVVQGVCGVFRALVLDDDIREEFGHAHDHARAIADCSLMPLVKLFQGYYDDKDIVGEILLTLSAIIVRNEYCEKVAEFEDGLGLVLILEVFRNFPDSEKLNRQCLKLLKTLAGSDSVKVEIVRKGAPYEITSAMRSHKASAQLTAAANGCIAALCLRSTSNSKAFCDAGAAALILEGMRMHTRDLSVQKQGCWAIRNIVSRTRSLCPLFLEAGAEELLNYILVTYGEPCEYDAKAALRDLGCSVVFREEWTGKGKGALN